MVGGGGGGGGVGAGGGGARGDLLGGELVEHVCAEGADEGDGVYPGVDVAVGNHVLQPRKPERGSESQHENLPEFPSPSLRTGSPSAHMHTQRQAPPRPQSRGTRRPCIIRRKQRVVHKLFTRFIASYSPDLKSPMKCGAHMRSCAETLIPLKLRGNTYLRGHLEPPGRAASRHRGQRRPLRRHRVCQRRAWRRLTRAGQPAPERRAEPAIRRVRPHRVAARGGGASTHTAST